MLAFSGLIDVDLRLLVPPSTSTDRASGRATLSPESQPLHRNLEILPELFGSDLSIRHAQPQLPWPPWLQLLRRKPERERACHFHAARRMCREPFDLIVWDPLRAGMKRSRFDRISSAEIF